MAEAVLADSQKLSFSQNDYDWLGHGVYFWEQNPRRALQYAELIRDNPKRGKTRIKDPAVLGAVIHPGYCLNLLESTSLDLLKDAFQLLRVTLGNIGVPLPRNIPVGEEKDILIRDLDCAVIETLHQDRKECKAREFDSARGVFFEGKELSENAGFKEKNHIQICVRNSNCIKGFFRVREVDSAYQLP